MEAKGGVKSKVFDGLDLEPSPIKVANVSTFLDKNDKIYLEDDLEALINNKTYNQLQPNPLVSSKNTRKIVEG
jgi:hypothetical protein